jgi:hypothetical protein
MSHKLSPQRPLPRRIACGSASLLAAGLISTNSIFMTACAQTAAPATLAPTALTTTTLAPGTQAVKAPAVAVVREGQAAAVLVVPTAATPLLCSIVDSFVANVARSTGARITVVTADKEAQAPANLARIFIGNTPQAAAAGLSAAALPEEGYRIFPNDGNVYIIAREDNLRPSDTKLRASAHPARWAFNRLLDDQLGVRWLWPGELGTYVPKHRNFTIPPIDVTYQPKLVNRSLRVSLNYAKDNTGTPAERQMEREAIEWQDNYQVGKRGPIGFGHAFGHWWEKYGKDHPDYFAQPLPGMTNPAVRPERMKLRLANPAVIEQIAKEYIAAESPEYYNVVPNDGSGFDVSDETRAWDIPQNQDINLIWNSKANLTGRYVMFWNKLSARLQQINPNVKLTTYAYSAYKSPPPPERPLTAKMVLALVAWQHDYDMWKGWSASGSPIFLRPNWWHQGANGPYLALDESYKFLKFASENGMLGFDMDTLMGYWGTQGANYYLVARFITRPDLTKDQILNEYTSAFGAGSPKIREYLNYWQKIATSIEYMSPEGKMQTLFKAGLISSAMTRASREAIPYLYPDDVIAPGYKLLVEADKLIGAHDAEATARVAFLRCGLDELVAMRDLMALSQQIKKKSTPALVKQFDEKALALDKLRTELSKRHVIWGEFVTRDEENRTVFFKKRTLKPTVDLPEEI